jgi:hypothetical protein
VRLLCDLATGEPQGSETGNHALELSGGVGHVGTMPPDAQTRKSAPLGQLA